MSVILVDGVGRVREIEHEPRRIIVYDGRSYERSDDESKINDKPIYRLVGYSKPLIRWGR